MMNSCQRLLAFRSGCGFRLAALFLCILASIGGTRIAECAELRAALVVGVGNYEHLADLSNPVRDATAFAEVLRLNGFVVTEVLDPTYDVLASTIDQFSNETEKADLVLTYFAGHGMAAVRGNRIENVIAPTDARISCEDREAEQTLAIDTLMTSLAHVPNRVFIFDACRNDPFVNCDPSEGRSRGYGFRMIDASDNGAGGGMNAARGATRITDQTVDRATLAAATLVAFSTDAGGLASDGPVGEHSPFAKELIHASGSDFRLPIREFLDRISERVSLSTRYDQLPWVVSLGGEPQRCLSSFECALRDTLNESIRRRTASILASRSQQLLNQHFPRKALALALEAVPTASPELVEPVVEDVLRRSAHRIAEMRRFGDLSGRLIATNANGAIAAVQDKMGIVSIVDTETETIISRLVSPDPFDQFERVYSAEFSDDGKRLLLASDLAGTLLFDAETGGLMTRIGDSTLIPEVVHLSNDGNVAVGVSTDYSEGTGDKVAWMYDFSALSLHVRGFESNRFPRDIAYSPDNNYIAILIDEHDFISATGSMQTIVEIYHSNDINEVISRFIALDGVINATTGVAEWVNGLKFVFNGQKMITWDQHIKVWNYTEGSLTSRMSGHAASQSGILSIDVDEESGWITSGGGDGRVVVSDLTTGDKIYSFELGVPISRVTASRPADFVAVKDTFDRTFLLNINKHDQYAFRVVRNEEGSFEYDRYWTGDKIAFVKGGSFLLTAAEDIVLVSTDDPSERVNGRVPGNMSAANFAGSADQVALAIGGRLVFTELATEKECVIKNIGLGYLQGAASFVSADGEIAIGVEPGTMSLGGHSGVPGKIIVVDSETCQNSFTLVAPGYIVSMAAISPSGAFVAASVYPSTDGVPSHEMFRVHVWDVLSREVISEFRGHMDRVTGLGFSPDEKSILTTAGDGTTRVWDIGGRRELVRVEATSGSLNNRAFTPDGSMFVTTSGGVRVWSSETGQMLNEFVNHRGGSAQFSPDGRLIVLVSGIGGPVLLLDADSGGVRERIDVQFSVISAEFSRDGRALLIVGRDGSYLVRDLEPDAAAFIERACALGPQELTENERIALQLDVESVGSVCIN